MFAEYEIPMAMMVFCAITAIVILVYALRTAFDRGAGEIGGWELRGARGRIFAVARVTLAEGLRTRIAAGFAIIILVSIPLFWLTAEGDGTIKGRVQMFLAYSMGFAGFLLALLTIFFSCRSLSMEIAKRQIYAVACKPIPRWQILVGKWTGVMTLNVALVIIACLSAYAGTVTILSRFKSHLAHQLETYSSLTPAEVAAAITALDSVRGAGAKGMDSPIIPVLADALGRSNDQIGDLLLRLPEATRVDLRRFDELRRQVLVSRADLTPEIPDMTEETNQIYEQMEAEGRLPAGWSPADIRQQIRAGLSRTYQTVSFGFGRKWDLHGPKPETGRNFLMSVRFKISASGYLAAEPEAGLEDRTMLIGWGLGDPGPDPPMFYEAVAAHPVNTFNEFDFPAECVADDGTITLRVANIDPRRVDAVFDLPWGLQVLYRVGSFELNLFQVGLAILIPLACLAAVGVCASTCLSFPVGSLILLTFYIISASIGFVAESLGTTSDYYDPNNITWQIQLRQKTVAALELAFAIGDSEPVDQLIEGRAIGWRTLWSNTWKFVFVKGLLVLILAVLIFRRRELAAVIV